MHQPYYKDTLQNRYILPWVRLHAIKGYFDMIDLLEEYPHTKVTFNLVPSLLQQLLDYCIPTTTDPFLEITLTPAQELKGDQKIFILENFFMAHWDNMIKMHPRYWDLLKKRGFSVSRDQLKKISENFQTKDFQDLQALANLAWFGYRAREKYPEINELIKKGQDFTIDEIHQIISLQRKIIQQVIPSYKKAFEEGRIDLTTSPFYHPILPLIYDTDIARRCMSSSPLPKRFSHPDDAEAQIQKGISFFKDIFGKAPEGMWPSEGSVCPELIPIFQKQQIQWIATDEEILTHSIPVHNKGIALFKPYQATFQDHHIDIVFRDRGLSDLIGFTYSQNTSEASIKNFLEHLTQIQKHVSSESEALVPIILDGENAWEHYKDGGEGFLRGIYQALGENPSFRSTTFTQYLKDSSGREYLPHLHSGSWIHHDFDIWIGSHEENTAWDYLRRTRDFVENTKDVSPEKKKQALEQIYIAEGSDWFWWYGDDFSTEHDEEFDQLFRAHLSACYQILGSEIPEFLHQSILVHQKPLDVHLPIGLVHPTIDGKNSHFYEWHEAGLYGAYQENSMHRSDKYIRQIFFGFDLSNFFLRIDPYQEIQKNNSCLEEIQLIIYLTKSGNCKYKIVLSHFFKKEVSKMFELLESEDGIHYKKRKLLSSAAFENMFELAIPFEEFKFAPEDEIKFKIAIASKGIILEMHPHTGFLTFSVPTKDFENNMWSA